MLFSHPLCSLVCGFCLSTLVMVPAGAQQPESTSLKLATGVDLEVVLVPAGKFQQGSPPTEAERSDDEAARETTLTTPFYLGKFPVTRRQFGEFVRQTGYRTEAEVGTSGAFGWTGGKLVQRKEFSWKNPGFPQTEDDPVTCVTYADAEAFVRWAAAKTRTRMALPTEAQWEYACRAGTDSAYYWGDSPDTLDEYAWSVTSAGDGTRPVGQKKPNAYGLQDMVGNVYQWCRDWYGPYPPSAQRDPEQTNKNLSDKPRRVLRGGAFHKGPKHLRSATRYRNDPQSRNADNGFRIAILGTLPQVAAPVKPAIAAPSPVAVPAPIPTAPPPADVRELPDSHESPVPDQFPPLPSGRIKELQRVPPPASRVSFSIIGLVCCLGVGGLVLIGLIAMASKVFGGSRQTDFPTQLPDSITPPTGPVPVGPMSVGPSTGRVVDDSKYTSDVNPIRIVEDGFWVRTAGVPYGATLVMEYTTEGAARRQRHVKRQPAPEAFIFTGATPSGCRIIEILPSPETDVVTPTAVDEPLIRPDPEPTPRAVFTGYPSAY